MFASLDLVFIFDTSVYEPCICVLFPHLVAKAAADDTAAVL